MLTNTENSYWNLNTYAIFFTHNIHTNQKTTQNTLFTNQIISCMLMDKENANFEILLRNYTWTLLVSIQMHV